MVELLIALSLVLLATLAVAALVIRPQAPSPDAAAQFRAFVEEARLTTMASGVPAILLIEPGKVSFGPKSLTWTSSDLKILESSAASESIGVVFYPDGTISASPPHLVVAGREEAFPGVSRLPAGTK